MRPKRKPIIGFLFGLFRQRIQFIHLIPLRFPRLQACECFPHSEDSGLIGIERDFVEIEIGRISLLILRDDDQLRIDLVLVSK